MTISIRETFKTVRPTAFVKLTNPDLPNFREMTRKTTADVLRNIRANPAAETSRDVRGGIFKRRVYVTRVRGELVTTIHVPQR